MKFVPFKTKPKHKTQLTYNKSFFHIKNQNTINQQQIIYTTIPLQFQLFNAILKKHK